MKENKNKVFIATSLDGFIAGKNGELDFLESIPELSQIDSGYAEFTSQIDALVMGRKTFETVLGFGIDWPYTKPVFIVSNTLTEVPEKLKEEVFLVKGTLSEILEQIHQQDFHQLYIDGGRLIQSFLAKDLIDEMVITIIPVLLGGGIPLFSELPNQLNFECVKSKLFLEKVAQNHFVRKR